METNITPSSPPIDLGNPQQTSDAAVSNWQSKIASYRVVLVIAALLLAGVGSAVFFMNKETTVPEASNSGTTGAMEGANPGDKSIKLQASDDPAVLEAEYGDINMEGLDAYIDNEVRALETDINQL